VASVPVGEGFKCGVGGVGVSGWGSKLESAGAFGRTAEAASKRIFGGGQGASKPDLIFAGERTEGQVSSDRHGSRRLQIKTISLRKGRIRITDKIVSCGVGPA